jgi:hypothetical protein
MNKDQDNGVATMGTGASEDKSQTKRQNTSQDMEDKVVAILENWRSAWSDISRMEQVTAEGPGYFLWHSDTNGSANPGAFFPAETIDQLIPPEVTREAVRKRLDTIDHSREMVVVLVLKEHSGARAVVAVIPKTAERRSQAWFEMAKHRKSPMAQSAWISLRADSILHREEQSGYEGYLEEYFGVGSVMFELEHREESKTLGWDDIGCGNSYGGGHETKYAWPEDSPGSIALTDAERLEGQRVHSAQTVQANTLASIRLPFTRLHLALNVQAKETEQANPANSAEPVKQTEPKRITTKICLWPSATDLGQNFVAGLRLTNHDV